MMTMMMRDSRFGMMMMRDSGFWIRGDGDDGDDDDGDGDYAGFGVRYSGG